MITIALLAASAALGATADAIQKRGFVFLSNLVGVACIAVAAVAIVVNFK